MFISLKLLVETMAEEVKLFKTWSSPFSLRIVWALKLKGIRYDSTDEDLSKKSHLLVQYNPVYKKIPVFVHNRKPIAESFIILEYIEETWKQNPLLPDDPQERAKARFWAKFGDEKVMPSVREAFLKEGKDQDDAFIVAIENLKFLEEELKGKKFFGGKGIGFVDIALGWLANFMPVLEEILGFKIIDKERFPLLLAWMQEFSNIPIIKESWPPHDKLVKKYRAILDSQLGTVVHKTT